MKWIEIPEFIFANYSVDCEWSRIEWWIGEQEKDCFLELNPEFQRGHVWTASQQSAYIEFCLRGGRTGRDLKFNYPNWQRHSDSVMPMYCVDGLQRLTAVREFLKDNVLVFDGKKHSDFEGHMRLRQGFFHIYVNELENYSEVLEWYLQLNTGGTVHSDQEILKVKKLLENEKIKREIR